MSLLQPLQDRYGFTPPPLWQTLHQEGCCDPHSPTHLQLSDLIWLSPAESAAWTFHADQIDGLVPFAQTSMGDLWCWYPALRPDGPAPVVSCPDEDEVAVVLAADFTAWLYRALLEEFACTCQTEYRDAAAARAVLGDYAERAQAWLPAAWGERLIGLSERLLQVDANDYHGLLDDDELADVIASDLADPLLEHEFEHIKPS